MLGFLTRRVLSAVVLVFVIASVTFGLLQLTGGNPARSIVGQNATAQQEAQKAAELGLDRPLLTQYLDWVAGLLRGDLGTSWFTGQPVSATLADALPVTMSIVLAGLLLSAVVSVLLGVAAAVRGGWLDRVLQVVSVLGFAVPSFLVALVLALFVAVRWGLLPATGYTSLTEDPAGWLRTITLPALALAVGAIAATAQQVRGSMLDVLRRDYVRTLRARGLADRSILFRHALRNAAPPALTVLSLQFIGLIGGAVVVEKVFGLSGIGTAALSTAAQGDQPVVLGIVVVTVVLIAAVNVLMDLAHGWLNPKVRV
ncbi:ABC transporter permease [Paenibacillus sp. TRM 82003]|uniref:ABC transporter permease n=1 Tax=Kineococcus sp. TRM81007 TaxID=2925831 RepID=UPI001F594EFA|nr:ABC transporter permease [Kineococcus sp. TRM81007]MCI2237755.1 ABC transporter permease [Kineococcus sp. TRM81007]MCI3921773.1 ABC transporter permease [Paenibacillus sp. TRM 82003]